MNTTTPRIIILGAGGFAGKMHAEVYARRGWTVYGVDPQVKPTVPLPPILWADAVVDVCTPTAIHVESVLEAYRRGARRFIVEKPQANSFDEWSRLMEQLPGATVYGVHNYLWSEAFTRAQDALGTIVAIESAFDKDRSMDDRRARGGHHGRLAPVLHVEAPHQFAMALAVDSSLEVTDTIVEDDHGVSAAGLRRFASVDLQSPSGVRATLTTNLRAPRRRTLSLTDDRGYRAEVAFARAGLEPATMTVSAPDGSIVSTWAGVDDALGRNLGDAVRSFELGTSSAFLGAAFATLVLRSLDAAEDRALQGAA